MPLPYFKCPAATTATLALHQAGTNQSSIVGCELAGTDSPAGEGFATALGHLHEAFASVISGCHNALSARMNLEIRVSRFCLHWSWRQSIALWMGGLACRAGDSMRPLTACFIGHGHEASNLAGLTGTGKRPLT